MPSAFLDTNILIYAAAGQRSDPDKAAVARTLIADGDFAISVQVLQEFYVTIAKPVFAMEMADIDGWISDLMAFDCAPLDRNLVLQAIELSRRYQISYWDGAIVAAAAHLKTGKLFSEDLSHGQTYGDVQVINPFAA